jgi:adenylate kinase
LVVFAYSEELRKIVADRTGEVLEEDDIRSQSAGIVTTKDVEKLDNTLIERVQQARSTRPFLIDSHPVTKESYGYRITSFSLQQLQALNPDVLVCLYTSPEVSIERIRRNPMGRPMVSPFEAEMHTQLQASVVAQYGVLLGKPVYLVNSAIDQHTLVQTIAERTGLTTSRLNP